MALPIRRVMVTGGSGFVGRNLIRALRARDVDVKALARSGSAQAAVAALGAEPVAADLRDVDAGHLAGCDTVFHAAALVKEWGPKAEFHAVNVLGTERLLEAARQAGVRRLVHVSTESVLVDGRPLVKVDEFAPYPAHPLPRYLHTKQWAERRVCEANGQGLETVVIRPRLIWGDHDTSLLPQLVDAVRAGKFMWVDGGRALTSTCHVDNVVHGALLAAEKGRPGGVYFLTDGEPLPIRQFLSRLMASQGLAVPDKSLPFGLAYRLAAVCEGLWDTLRLPGQPPVTRMPVALFGQEITVDDSRARYELGYAPVTTLAAGLGRLGA